MTFYDVNNKHGLRIITNLLLKEFFIRWTF